VDVNLQEYPESQPTQPTAEYSKYPETISNNNQAPKDEYTKYVDHGEPLDEDGLANTKLKVIPLTPTHNPTATTEVDDEPVVYSSYHQTK